MTKKSKGSPKATAEQEAALNKVVEDIRRGERVHAGRGLVLDAFVGRLVGEVRSVASYGEKAVERLATKLKRSPTVLYRLKERVDIFDEEALQKAMELAHDHCFLLSGSHFDELVQADPRERDVLLEDTIRKGWSVRELHRQIHGDPEPTSQTESDTTSASTIIARSESLRQALKSIPANDGSLLPAEERERTVAVLAELTNVISDAVERLIALGVAP